MRRTITTAAALLAATAVLGTTAPATADGIGVSDPRDTHHGVDLRSVQVRNLDHRVVVVTTHTNLRRDPDTGSAGAVYIDTDRSDRGPEYVFVGGYFAGTDYQLLHTEGFGRHQWGRRAAGFHEMTVNYRRDMVRMRMSRASLGRPDEVRAAVKVTGTRTDGSGVVDWLGEPRSSTMWVDRG